MRQLFRELDLVQRALANNYIACADRSVIQRTLPGTGQVYSMLIRFMDENGVGRFTVHCYLDANWKIVSYSKLLDPKMVIDEGGVRWQAAA
jgi:hypothetical protein